ncbi:hypothetical protein JKF63_01988 [Porcisia hertigi]|uniref:Uncharacterized protein n=1 Tax=Porcisia hertigi TaxID=2761500 RepID=A0A836LBD5_9TRYP|nr:hypothetical protein JKF63_01988 [Porcisia hertigi]
MDTDTCGGQSCSMESKVTSLLNSRPLLTVTEAAVQLGVSHDNIQMTFTSLAAAHEDIYQLLSCCVEEAAKGNSAAFVMRRADPVNVDTPVHALMSLTYPSNVTASTLPVQLHPSAGATLRAYPVVTRAVMESRTAGTCAPTPLPAAFLSSNASLVATDPPPEAKRSKTEESEAAVAPPSIATHEVPKTASPPGQKESPRSTPICTTAACLKEEASPRSLPPSFASTPIAISTSSPKPTIFDKMREAAATKRPRTEAAPAKALRQSAKPRAASKTGNTVSLAKLARASKKKSCDTHAATGGASALSPKSFLDDDDDDDDTATCLSHREDSGSQAETVAQQEAPILDVVEVSAFNDEIIMYDGAPPLAFRPAAPTLSLSTPRSTKEGLGAAKPDPTAVTPDARTVQGKLLSFFSAAVVEFQKSYVREVQTETSIEDGEFVCCDVPCYKHNSTGEVITEEEYRQRTAALIRRNSGDAAGSTSNKKLAGALSGSRPSPTAAPKTVSGNAQKPEKTRATPTKTLLSFNFSSA